MHKNAVAEKEKQLQNEQSQLTKLQDELNQKQADLTAKISSTSGELEQYSASPEAKERAKAVQEALDKEVIPLSSQRHRPVTIPVLLKVRPLMSAPVN